MTTKAARVAVVAILFAAAACKDKKKESGATASPASEKGAPAGTASPASEPDLPEPLALDCARIVPDQVRDAHFPQFAVEPIIQSAIATCSFSDSTGTLRPSVSLFCHRRKRNWNFADELARDKRKTAVDGVGRGAYARNDHVFFYPSRLDCLARVIWPGDPKKGAEIARALDAHLSKSTVTAPPAP